MKFQVLFILKLLVTIKVASSAWFEGGNFYQIYPRSFKDSDGDGIGDLQGIRSKLQHLKDLGMDGVWLSPVYKSPMVDFGYDVSDFREIHYEYGTMSDFEQLIEECKKLCLRLVMDFVPNHSSSENEWFIKSERREPGYEDFYVWQPGKFNVSSNATMPPNNWVSAFRFSAWTWSDIRQEFYYHKYHSKQPDLNYRNPKVIEAMNEVLLFWLRKGVSGFRIDAVSNLFEEQNPDGTFPDEPRTFFPNCGENDHCYLQHIYTRHQEKNFEMVYKWRQMIDNFTASYGLEPIVLMTESFEPINFNLRYYGNGSVEGSHIPFNFELIKTMNINSTAKDYKDVIERWLIEMPVGHQANWVLGTHDVHRLPSRLGVNRGDLLNIMLQTLPGFAITYQGEEIMMEDVDVSWEDTVDPKGKSESPATYKKVSRDSSRTPFAWDDSENAGFSTAKKTWLPVGDKYKTVNVKAQEAAENSHLKIFRRLTSIRKHPVFKQGSYDGRLSNSGTVYLIKREFKDLIAIILLNFGEAAETINMKSFFPSLSKRLKIYTSSLSSGLKNDVEVDTSEVRIGANIGAVFVSENITMPAAKVCKQPKCLIKFFMK